MNKNINEKNNNIAEAESISFEAELKINAEDRVKRVKEILDARQAYYNKLTDQELKKAASIEVQNQKKELEKANKELEDVNKRIQDNMLKARESEKKKKESITNIAPLEVVAETVLESINEAVMDKHKYVSAPVIGDKYLNPPVKKTPTTPPAKEAEPAPVVAKKPAYTAPPSVPAKKTSYTPPQQSLPAKSSKKSKTVLVRFDKETKQPFNVKFSRRGFLIGETRLSFELLEKALSKDFSITLNDGFILDKVRMQKILKYKEKI
jgi:hypothetical protein